MSALRKTGAEAWPIAHAGSTSRPVLDVVIVESRHPGGAGTIHLSPDQSLYVHSRLSTIASTFVHGNASKDFSYGVSELPEDHSTQMGRSGARVWPITERTDGLPPVLQVVVVESHHPNGSGLIQLTPDQALYIHSRLTHINLAFLHENEWGGEDSRSQ